jgi:anti-anti-sigma factor
LDPSPTGRFNVPFDIVRAVVAESGTVEVEELARATLIRLDGEFDIGNSLAIEQAVLAGVDRDAPLVVDMTTVVFIDSTALMALVRPAKSSAHEVAIVAPPRNHAVHRLLELLPLPAPFRVVSGTDEVSGHLDG